MLLHPRNLKHHVAAANRSRYALNNIALTPLGTLSTDGHALLLAPYPDENPKDAPKIEGVNPASPAPQVGPFLVSMDDAAKASTMVGKSRRHVSPFTELLQVEIQGDSIRFGATDLSASQTMQVKRVEGPYPDVGRVIPDYSNAHTVSVNLDQLLRSLKALKGATKDEVVTLRLIDDQQAIGFSCKDGTAMLCMPIQVERPEEHVPDQLAKLRSGPPVAAPAAPEEEDEDASFPSEVEMEEAQEVHDAQPITPPPADPVRIKRRRRKSVAPSAELAEILGS